MGEKGRGKGPIVPRLTRQQLVERVMRAKALIDGGAPKEEAYKRAGISQGAYTRWAGRGFKFPGVNIDSGAVSAASIPPRPGKGGKRTPKPVDMDNIESIAKRLTKVNRMINDVRALTEEKKRLATRLLHLLKG